MALSIEEVQNDASLVHAAQQGDSAAFGELFRRHYSGVRRVCARRLGNLVDADEVAQAAFVRAFERLDRCQGDRRFGGWVQMIAHNLCVDTHRARARTTPDEEPLKGEAAVGPNGPEDALMRSEQAQLVRDALASLPERQRDVVVARDLEGRRPTEIAAAFGLTLGAVDSLLLRGRRRLASTVENMALETGAASPATLATVGAAAGSAGGAGPLGRVVGAFNDLVIRVSHHMASGLGIVPGATPPGARVAALVATVAVFAPLAVAPQGDEAAPAVDAVTAPAFDTAVPPPVPAPPADLLTEPAPAPTPAAPEAPTAPAADVPPPPADAPAPAAETLLPAEIGMDAVPVAPAVLDGLLDVVVMPLGFGPAGL